VEQEKLWLERCHSATPERHSSDPAKWHLSSRPGDDPHWPSGAAV